jgi:hypothetical protein
MDWVIPLFICIIIGILVWGVHKIAYISGRHHDRMLVLGVIDKLNHNDIINSNHANLSAHELKCLLLDRLQYAWGNIDKSERR